LQGLMSRWPLVEQLKGGDRSGRGAAARSTASTSLTARTESATEVVPSVCPFCAVGCGQRVFVRDGEILQIEGDPDSPISRGRLCPKGAASRSLITGPHRLTKIKYRPPFATDWEELDLDEAMDRIADRIVATRAATWQEHDAHGRRVARSLGVGSLGGATLDNEENYLLKKLLTALGFLQVENQARI
jgi:formate dehydrogenase major subunit